MAHNTRPNFDPNTQTEVRIRRPGRAPEYVVLQGDIDVRIARQLKRTSLMPDSEVTTYRSHNVYIIDDKDRSAGAPESRRDAFQQTHEDNCDQIHNLFTVYFGGNCQVRSVRFHTHRGPDQLTRYFQNEFRERKYTSEDLVIIYYHGKAGGNGKEYAWETLSCPARAQNVHNLFTFINGTMVDCLFLLDSFMPTHYTEDLKRYGRVTEIVQAGKNPRTPDEVPIPGRSNFTETLASTLIRRVEEVDQHFRSWKARKTFPELMAKDVAICSHPMRKNTNRTWADSTQVVWRLAVCPRRLRLHGYLELVAVRLQGRRNAGLPTPPESDNADDDVEGSFANLPVGHDRQDAGQPGSSRKRKRSSSQIGSLRSESPDSLFVTQRSDSGPTGGLNASQRDIIRGIEASGSFARGEDGGDGAEGGFDFIESLGLAGRRNTVLDEDHLQVSGGLGAVDDIDELFLF